MSLEFELDDANMTMFIVLEGILLIIALFMTFKAYSRDTL